MVNNIVVQEDSAGCGVACVAALLNISYSSTLRLFDNSQNIRAKGVLAKEIVRVLEQSGLKAECKYVKPHIENAINQTGTIVYTAKNNNYPLGHYLLRLNNGWMNPWANFPNIRNPEARVC